MFGRAAKYIDKVVSYPSNLLSAMAMVAIVFVVLAVTVDVFMRYVFNSPIYGLWDLCTLAFCIIVWCPMAMAAFKGSHVALTFLLEKLPRLPRLGLELIIALVSGVVLGIVSWRLVLHGILLGKSITQTGVLRIAYEPFVYIAASACAMMALVFLARVPETVGKIRKEPETVGRIEKEAETVEKMKGSSA
jgi:TRAP-type C4-dicarboxylate transport system permease small subunit